MADETTYRRRRGFWLRVARERKIRPDGKSWTLEDLARALDYSTNSTSTFSRWESGERDPSDVQLRHVAEVLEVPLEVFTDPEPTTEERLEERISEINAAKARRAMRPTA